MSKKEGFNSEEVEKLDLEADRLSKRYNQEFLSYLVIRFKNKMKEKK